MSLPASYGAQQRRAAEATVGGNQPMSEHLLAAVAAAILGAQGSPVWSGKANRVPPEAAIAVAAADVGRVAGDVGEVIAFHTSGARFVGELRCSDCGYGIVSRGLLPTCPMCRGQTWEEAPWRPFTREPGRM